jgi:predicted negative regulator of RcsB-dependent stress response
MDVLTDDHEREQVVRKWWSENWKSLTLGIVIAIGGMVGYGMYQNYQRDTAQKYAYEMNTLKNALNVKQASAEENAKKFIAEHKDIYGSLLSLDMASFYASEGKYDEAVTQVKFAKDNGGELVAPNAYLAEAHLLLQQKKYEDAIKVVEGITASAYTIEKNEILGDIYYSMGEKDKAHDAYLNAITECESKKIAINPLLQMKADNLIKEGENPAYKRAQALTNEIARSASEIKR